MTYLDTNRFPLVIAHAEQATTLDGIQQFVAEFDELLARGDTFGVVIVSPTDDHKTREKGVNKTLTMWVKQNKPRIAAQCVAIGSIVPSAAQYLIYKPLVKLQGERIYGCPTDLFQTQAEAEEWVQSRLAPK